jgi:hypothetical protein
MPTLSKMFSLKECNKYYGAMKKALAVTGALALAACAHEETAQQPRYPVRYPSDQYGRAIATPGGQQSHYVPASGAAQPPRPPIAATKTIQVMSEPPEARIEVNGDYVGDAPCSIEVPSFADGRFRERTVIRAIPTRGGDYTQTKIFEGYAAFNNPYMVSDKIPNRIFFNMNLGPANPEIDVNVH